MAEPQAGPIFKIGAVYVRTRINGDGTRGAHPGDVGKIAGSGAFRSDGEFLKMMAWMRDGKRPPTPQIEIRKIPFAVMPVGVVGTPDAVLESSEPASVYTTLFALMGYLGLAAEEGEEYVNAGVLKLSALKPGAQLEAMLVRGDDAQAFVGATGLRPFSGVVS